MGSHFRKQLPARQCPANGFTRVRRRGARLIRQMWEAALLYAALIAVQAIWAASPTAAQVLSGDELKNLLAGGEEGTSILFPGGTDKIFYSPTLTNGLRRSPEVGPDFLRSKIQHNTINEGVFVSTSLDGKGNRTITGLAGVSADQESGFGVLTMIQTFQDDHNIRSFERRDRLYAVLIVEQTNTGIICRRSRWERLFAFKGQHTMTTVPCEFAVGNLIVPAVRS